MAAPMKFSATCWQRPSLAFRAIPSGIALIAVLLCPAPVLAKRWDDSDRSFITLQSENDLFARAANSDRHYTNGVQASWLSAPRDDLPGWTRFFTSTPFALTHEPITEQSTRVGVSLGQAIFTPDNTDTRARIPTDRPYAAWLHATFSLQSVRSTASGAAWQDQWKLDLGVVGPAALGRQVQNRWHKLINAAEPQGWGNQLPNEPGLNVSVERAWRSRTFATPEMLGFQTDFIPYGVVALGNVQTYAAAGGTFRLGYRLPDDFGPPRVYPGIGGSEWFRAQSAWSGYLFVGAEGRAVARDIFLDGSTFRDSMSVQKRHFVSDVKLGGVLLAGNYRLSYTHVFRSKEFHGQPKADQFGAFTLGVGF